MHGQPNEEADSRINEETIADLNIRLSNTENECSVHLGSLGISSVIDITLILRSIRWRVSEECKESDHQTVETRCKRTKKNIGSYRIKM